MRLIHCNVIKSSVLLSIAPEFREMRLDYTAQNPAPHLRNCISSFPGLSHCAVSLLNFIYDYIALFWDGSVFKDTLITLPNYDLPKHSKFGEPVLWHFHSLLMRAFWHHFNCSKISIKENEQRLGSSGELNLIIIWGLIRRSFWF